jgi:hypothetical protein
MALNNIPEPGKDACQNGALNLGWIRSIWKRVTRKLRIVLPPGLAGAVFLESEEDVTLDLSKVNFATAASTTYPLKIVNATESGVAKIKVIAGLIGGGSVPETTVTLTANGVRYIKAKVPFSFNTSTGTWQADTGSITIVEGASGTHVSDATHLVFELGRATRVTSGAGFAATTITPAVSGNQEICRWGTSSDYSDFNVLQ